MSEITSETKRLPVVDHLADSQNLKPRWSVPVPGSDLVAADPRATRAMVALMDMEAQIGGAASHFGGPSAFAELMSGLHAIMFTEAAAKKTKWTKLFHFVNDAGHCENGLYALKANYGFAGLTLESLRGFRSVSSKLTGHGEAHLFPEGVLISNGPLGSGLPQAQGLAMADALSGEMNRVTICALSDGGAMEGEAREAFAAIPGFAAKGKAAPFVMIVSDNRTKLSGRIDQDAFSMNASFEALASLGWDVIELKDGHNLAACAQALNDAISRARKNPMKPVAIHAHTIKGKGNKKAEESKTGAHGFPLKSAKELPEFLTEIYAGSAVPQEFMAWVETVKAREEAAAQKVSATVMPTAPGALRLKETKSEKIQIGVASAMIEARKRGYPVVSVSADLQGSTGVADFHKAFPQASIDIGIAESNMISTAAGLSLAGFIPFVDTFAQFGVTKGALPLTMANLSHAPVIGIFSHTGFQDAADGASHQALSFFAQVASIPHVDVYSLSSSSEAHDLVTEVIETFARDREAGRVPRTSLFFLGRENFPSRMIAPGLKHTTASWPLCLDTTAGMKKSVVIAASGSLVPEALKAADLLLNDGIGAFVFHASNVNHPDLPAVKSALAKVAGALVTVEEHRLTCGMGSMLIHELVQGGVHFKARSLGIGDHFGQSAYSALELYKKHGLDAGSIANAAKALV